MQELQTEESQSEVPVSNYPRHADHLTFDDYRVLVDSCYGLIGIAMLSTVLITCFQTVWIQRYFKVLAISSPWHEVVVAVGIGLLILFMYGLFAKSLSGHVTRSGSILGWSRGRSWFWIALIVLTSGMLVGSFLLLLLVDRFQRPLARAKIPFRVGAKKVDCLAEIAAREQRQKSIGQG